MVRERPFRTSATGAVIAALQLWAVVCLLVVGMPSAAAQQGGTGGGEGDEAAAEGGLQAVAEFLPLGKVHESVVYPVFEDGALSSILTAGKMLRSDEEFLDISVMEIELYQPDGSLDYRVDLKSAIYHLPTEELSSEEETTIKGKSFAIRGDRCAFDLRAKRGRLEGNIRMVISDLEGFAPSGITQAQGGDEPTGAADAAGDNNGGGEDPENPAGDENTQDP